MITAADQADVGAFLTRLLRLDPAALARLRPAADGSGIWAMLPFRVLVHRRLTARIPVDVTVSAAELLAVLTSGGGEPARRDSAWRWPVPSGRGRVVETIPAAEVVRLAAAAAQTLRTAAAGGIGGRAVGERVVRDALLDHISIVVTTDEGDRVEVPQRMVQAMTRMGFLGNVIRPGSLTQRGGADTSTSGDNSVTVRLAMGWIGLDGLHGSAWYRPISPLRLG